MPYNGFDESNPRLASNVPLPMNGRGRGTEKRRRTPREPYTRNNPPTTIEEAADRLDELDRDIMEIRWQLDFAEMDHLSPKEHEDWEKRASRALSYKEAERDFVSRSFIILSVAHVVTEKMQAAKK